MGKKLQFLDVQAYLRDIMGLVPDYCNKTNITINWITQILCFSNSVQTDVYTILQFLKRAIALCLKNAHTLIKKYFISKKY